MIKNQRQYDLTRAQVTRFEEALASLAREQDGSEADPRLLRAEREAAESQLQDLHSELEAYNALREGRRAVLELRSLADLPKVLIQARIAANLSHSDLAGRLGMREQQIQRYEATDYSGANLDRLQEVASALGIEMREEVLVPNKNVTLDTVFRTAKKAGIDRDLILRRFLPRSLAHRIARGVGDEFRAAVEAAEALARVFGGSLAAWLGEAPLPLTATASAGVRFKVASGVSEPKLSAYTVYAHHLALLVLQATEHLSAQPVPTDPTEVRARIIERSGKVDLTAVLEYVWALGIPVLPLKDPGAFHGACFRVEGRNVIVLKQRTTSEARWLFDLLHEYRHTGEDPEQSEFAVIETAEIASTHRLSKSERIASAFAGAVSLAGRAEELAQMAVERARGKTDWLQRAVAEVAQAEGVSQGALANYVAFRLSMDNQPWWGAAQNLQEPCPDPWRAVRDKLLLEADFGRLSPMDREFLQRALTEEED